MIRAAIAMIATAFALTGCAAPQPSPIVASPAPQVASATPTATPTATPSPTPTEPPTPEPTLPPISEAAALLAEGFTIVSEDDHSGPNGRVAILRTVVRDTYLDAAFACDGQGRIEITLQDASAGLPSPGVPDERNLGVFETACSTAPEGLSLPGPDHDAAIGIIVRAPENARYWVVVGAPTEDVRP